MPLSVCLWGGGCSERGGSDADDEHQASCWAPVQQSRKRSAPIRKEKQGCGILVKLTDKEQIEGSVFDKDIKHG